MSSKKTTQDMGVRNHRTIRCLVKHAGGGKAGLVRQERKLKDHFFLPIISERRTIPRVRFFCIWATVFA